MFDWLVDLIFSDIFPRIIVIDGVEYLPFSDLATFILDCFWLTICAIVIGICLGELLVALIEDISDKVRSHFIRDTE